MSPNESILFTPLVIGKLSITGRIIKTATSETRATAALRSATSKERIIQSRACSRRVVTTSSPTCEDQ